MKSIEALELLEEDVYIRDIPRSLSVVFLLTNFGKASKPVLVLSFRM